MGNSPGSDGLIRAAYELEGENALVGGDILWPVDSMLSSRAAAGPFNRWKNGIIPYDNSVNSQVFIEGVNAWNAVSSQTGVTFVRRTNQRDYLLVVSERRCSSFMGRRGGAQILDLVEGGCIKHSAIHELGHAIGLMHEHTRADRDSYIRFNWDNIGGGPSTIDNKNLSAKDISGVAAMYAGFGGAGNGGGGNGGGGNGGGGNGGGGTTCQIATCSEYGMTEGECYEFGTGSFECKSSCLERVSVCQNTQSDGWSCNNGEQIPANYYCDGIVDCNDNSDETSCGGTDNGGSGTGGSSWGACDVSGFAGECMDTSTSICNGTLFTGYCPGGSEIRCCI